MRALTAASAFLAAGAAGAAGVSLARTYLGSRRPNAACWAASCLFFALASLALATGAVVGWSPWLFRAYYLAGGVLTVPWMAVGAAWLFGPKRAASVATIVLIAFSALAAIVTSAAVVQISGAGTAPAHATILESAPTVRALARIANAAGTIGAIVLFVHIGRSFRRKGVLLGRARGSTRIAAGVGMAAVGGVLAGIELPALHAPSLAVAGVLMFIGFRRWARTPTALPASEHGALTR